MTIHNMAFQGHFGREIFGQLGLPRSAWSIDGVEYHGGVGFLKAGMAAASAITTVSPTYAAEIRDPEFGMGLEGLIASRGDRVCGHRQRHRYRRMEPGDRSGIWPRITPRERSASAGANKRALEAEFGLEPGDGPLFIVVSRLTWQKGMDVLLEAARPPRRHRRQAGAAGIGRCGDGSGLPGRRRAPSRPDRHAHRLRRGALAPHAGRRRRDPGALALRAVRADPALRPRLWLRARRRAHWRAGGYGDRRQPRGDGGGDGHRHPVRRGALPRAGDGDQPHRGALPPAGGVARDPAQWHEGGLLLGPQRQGLCRALPAIWRETADDPHRRDHALRRPEARHIRPAQESPHFPAAELRRELHPGGVRCRRGAAGIGAGDRRRRAVSQSRGHPAGDPHGGGQQLSAACWSGKAASFRPRRRAMSSASTAHRAG